MVEKVTKYINILVCSPLRPNGEDVSISLLFDGPRYNFGRKFGMTANIHVPSVAREGIVRAFSARPGKELKPEKIVYIVRVSDFNKKLSLFKSELFDCVG